MLAKEVAKGIIEREIIMGIHNRVVPGPADNSINDVQNGNSIAADMRHTVRANGSIYKGVEWTRSDKRAGSRKSGWERVRTMLFDACPPATKGPRESPGLFVFRNCKHFVDLFPTLPRDEKDPDDVDTDAEDHIGDETRYRVLACKTGAKTGKTKGL